MGDIDFVNVTLHMKEMKNWIDKDLTEDVTGMTSVLLAYEI